MNAARLRMLIALGNLAVVTMIGLLAFKIVKGAPFPPEETPNESFDPVAYEVPDTGGPKSEINAYRAVWLQLDRAPPPPKPVVRQAAPPPQQPTAVGLATRYRLVTVYRHPSSPDRNTAIVEQKGSRSQKMIKQGGELDGFTVEKIDADGENAILQVKSPSGRSDTIRLERASQ